jgi:TatD DNase family protein
MRLIDTHCHLDLYPDYSELIEEIERGQIATIAVTNAPSVFRPCQALTRGKRFIRPALGLHPELVPERYDELGLMKDLLPETPFIGEVGLDFAVSDASHRVLQQKAFAIILEQCAQARDKVLTVHSRRAAADVVNIIGGSFPGTIILHWFSGSLGMLERALSYGYYLSINPAMCVSASGQKIIRAIPRERVLTETDGPFVTLEGRPARPADISLVTHHLARAWNVEPDEVSETVYTTFQTIVRK